MDINEIKRFLPHRYPFLLVDRVEELKVGESIVARKAISYNEPQFVGHFENNPIFPGVYIIEAMAQTCGLLALKTLGQDDYNSKAYVLAGTDKARFKRSVIPGDQLMLYATIISNKRGIWKFNAEARVEDEMVASAILLCAERDLD